MARTHAHGGTVVSALNNRDEISYLREPANYANPRRVKTIPLITLETINYDGGSKGTDREWKFVRLPVSSRCHIMPHPPLFPLSFSLFDFIPSLLFSFFFPRSFIPPPPLRPYLSAPERQWKRTQNNISRWWRVGCR